MPASATTAFADPRTDSGIEFPFAGLEAAFDPVTRRHLTKTGLGPGWDCWEVGAGGGSVARWMADAVGSSGSVLATDIDATLIPPLGRPHLRVVEHDLVWDPLPGDSFRCIHARLVLGNLPERQDVLAWLARRLVPGGWIVIEDLDLVVPACTEVATPEERLVHRVRAGFAELLGELRGDSGWARSLIRRLRALGLVDVSASAQVTPVTGGSVASSIERAHLALVAEKLVTSGVATEEELDRCLQLLDDPGFRFVMAPMVTAWGRRR